ncbi:hypothetical protein CYK25_000370 [Varibaculum cambriense]|nr:hypothetical protein CYK25_000370 [Varibaculum cambriense]
MMDLPLGLAKELIPLAWLLGSWRGWGTALLPKDPETESGEREECFIWQETTFRATGTNLQQATLTWLAEPVAEKPDMQADAATGLKQLRRGALLWREDTSWRVTAAAVADSEQEARSRCRLTSTGGPYTAEVSWEAVSMGTADHDFFSPRPCPLRAAFAHDGAGFFGTILGARFSFTG